MNMTFYANDRLNKSFDFDQHRELDALIRLKNHFGDYVFGRNSCFSPNPSFIKLAVSPKITIYASGAIN